jgi:hypothetical protein
MTHQKTVVNTGYGREISVSPEPNGTHVTLLVQDTDRGSTNEILSSVPNDKAKVLGKALFESAGGKFAGALTVPEATHRMGWVISGEFSYADNADPELVQQRIDNLRAIRNKLIALKKEKNDLECRRNKLAQELTDDPVRTYEECIGSLRSAIDRIISLEDAAK